MEFFDKKQDVIDIELTQFGKNLLSRGAFRPAYYQMFDDGIIYDYSYYGVSEKQNDIDGRIFQAQRPKDNHNVYGVERSFIQQNTLISKGQRGIFQEIAHKQDPLIKEKILKSPLTYVDSNTQDAPRFEIGIRDAGTSTKEIGFILSDGHDIKIPQLSISPRYIIEVDDRKRQDIEDEEDKKLYDSEVFFDLTSEKMTFFNKTTIETIPQDILLNIVEYNTPYETENFEIELYEVTEEEGKERAFLIEDNKEIFQLFDIITDDSHPVYHSELPKRKRFFVD